MIRIIPTDDHDSLNGFYAGNDLEISEDDPTDTSAVKSWKLYDGDDFAGATTLAYRQGDFIIDGIAVDKDHRGSMLGTGLIFRISDFRHAPDSIAQSFEINPFRVDKIPDLFTILHGVFSPQYF